MKKIISYFKKPFEELSNTRTLTVCAMLIAICVVSSIFSFYVGNALKFSFSFVFIAIIGTRYGPVIAAFSAAITDIIQYIVKPIGPYQPLLTLSCAMVGMIFGIFLYKNKIDLWRIIVSRAIICVFISTLLDSYFISMLYGKVFKEYLLIRTPKNIIMLPIEIAILTGVLYSYNKIQKKLK